ncbi:Rft protein-domain-containing protein [Rhodotorula diobovata]|uniref:Man(5)GlcNAc(2)-PP-dolichol translocation protein RFT1 n=1 Tax=Rhodotorula diobovata TaxID=5288 RepID=A0A5C5G6V8_9BASI|nr:Rft protein-domain-containing protein [Rhodotorula diobovata]
MAPSVLSTTLSLVGLQVASRLFSFGLNQALLRSTTPQAFGLATIQLDTLAGTVLFLLREGIRGAVVRTRTSTSPAEATLQRQSLLLPTLLTPLAVGAFALYHTYASPSPAPPQYGAVLALYLLATVVELLSEPLYLRTLQSWETLTTRRVRVEGAAVLAKAVGTLATVRAVSEADALLAFGVGQLVYSATIWAGLAWVSASTGPWQHSTTIGLRRVDGRLFDPAVTTLGWALTKQSVVKQLLTEGDKLAVGKFGSATDMGGYAVALNYGSLLARIVFQPLEESSRLYFSSLSAAAAKAPDRGDAERADKESSASPQYSTFEVAPTPDTLRAVASHLRLLLLFYSHLSLIFTCLAPSFTTPLLHLLLGSRWSRTSASPLLRAYALSLPFLAFNGLTEAFFQSVAPPRWIARGSAWLVACAGAFAASVWFLMRVRGWGAEGLVAANCVNLAMRTALSSVFVQRYFAEAREARKDSKEAEGTEATLSPRSWVPRWPTVVAFGAAAWIVRRSEARWQQEEATKGAGLRLTLEHLGVGAVVGVACLAVIAFSHRSEIRERLAAKRRTAARKVQ